MIEVEWNSKSLQFWGKVWMIVYIVLGMIMLEDSFYPNDTASTWGYHLDSFPTSLDFGK